jgi:hypothetical protein
MGWAGGREVWKHFRCRFRLTAGCDRYGHDSRLGYKSLVYTDLNRGFRSHGLVKEWLEGVFGCMM